MKPTFALDLTRDAIALLHRTPKGWLSIGEVAFDTPDLAEALDYLRKTALGLSPMELACKIVLPASQILYAEIHAPGPSRDEKRRQIAAALEGRTPYAVEDLVFDWSGKGATVKVAVVARETLDEAEAFATAHRLNPVSFVAIPEDGTFVGEPWFGPTSAAASILAEGETVDRDREPVSILERHLPVADPDEPLPGLDEALNDDPPVAAPVTEVAVEVAVEGAEKGMDPLPGLEEALNAELPVAEAAADAAPPAAALPEPLTPELEDQGDALPGGHAPDLLDEIAAIVPVRDVAEDDAQGQTLPDLPVSGQTAPDDQGPDPETDPETEAERLALSAALTVETAAPSALADADEAPFTEVADSGDPDPEELPRSRKLVLDDIAEDDLPPAAPAAAMVAFSSRRSTAATTIPRPVAGSTRAEAATAPAVDGGVALAAPVAAPESPPVAAPVAMPATGQRAAPAKGLAGLVTAPTIPGTRTKPRLKPGVDIPRPAVDGATTVKSPTRPGGTFGNVPPARKRTGMVFLVLVAFLLIGLALVAAWASFYLKQGEGPRTEAVALVATPGIDDEMLADLQDPEDLPESGAWADAAVPAGETVAAADEVAPQDPPVNLGAEDDAAVATLADAVTAVDDGAAIVGGEPAPATTLATDISAAQPPVEDQDEIFLSAMDAPPPALDALALPAPAATVDAPPAAPLPPPAPGTLYQFGADGLLKPTPDGILSPDGVMLIAGKPPVLPPSRSEAATALAAAAAAPAPEAVAPEAVAPEAVAPEAVAVAGDAPTAADASLVTAGEAEVVPAPADPAMAGFRPRPRPEGLVPESDDDARVTTEGGTEVVTLRPLPRPASVLAAAAALQPAGEVAVADLGAQGASLAAQAEAELAAAAALEAANPSVVAISKRPAARPRDLSRAVEAAVAAAVREPEPEAEVIAVAAAAPAPEIKPDELDEMDEPEVAGAAPSIPTKASVAKQATYAKAINLKKLNLIGTYGTDSRRYALIRQANGSYKKVKVGDKIDGGTVKAITETEVRYQKGGKLLVLKMPKA